MLDFLIASGSKALGVSKHINISTSESIIEKSTVYKCEKSFRSCLEIMSVLDHMIFTQAVKTNFIFFHKNSEFLMRHVFQCRTVID